MENEEDNLLAYVHHYKKTSPIFGNIVPEELEKLIKSEFNGMNNGSVWLNNPRRQSSYTFGMDAVSKSRKNVKKLPAFDKYTALDMHTTTIAQRRHIHKLYEELGGAVATSTESRDIIRKGEWDYHLYIDTAFASEPLIKGVAADQSWVHKLKFFSYEWWLRKLNGVKFLDSTESSPTDTFLDKQLENYEKKKLGS